MLGVRDTAEATGVAWPQTHYVWRQVSIESAVLVTKTEEGIMIIGISGLANAGKDTVADLLTTQMDFVKVSLADPMKRFCAEVFGWDRDRLWGPSAMRNAIDERLPRGPADKYRGYLTARHALQTLGTEWGRGCYENVWINYGLRMAKEILDGDKYDPEIGAMPGFFENVPAAGVVIPDIRFQNELAAVRKAGGEVWRIVRNGAGLQGEAAQHASENDIQEGDCDRIILNNGTIRDLTEAVRLAVRK